MNKKKRFMDLEELHKYDDIIGLPRHVSRTHPPMPAKDRAAQFAPFAALTGHREAVKETARVTDTRVELDEYCKEQIDRKLKEICGQAGGSQIVSVTYFVPDARKSGGSYETVTGCVKKINDHERVLVMEDGIKIPLDEIIGVEACQQQGGFGIRC